MRIERLGSVYDLRIEWRYFPLHPETPEGGRSLEDLFAGRGYDLAAMHAQMKARMEAEGLPYGHRTHTYNSRLAEELASWSDSLSGSRDLHGALYRGYFVENRNIGDPEVLVGIAESVGLSAAGARKILEGRDFSGAVDRDWETARRYGIRGVPTFVCGSRAVVGAQPYEVLEALVQHAGAERRSDQA